MNEEDFINVMKNCGWKETEEGIVNDSFPENEPYDDWTSAIIACIEVASGV